MTWGMECWHSWLLSLSLWWQHRVQHEVLEALRDEGHEAGHMSWAQSKLFLRTSSSSALISLVLRSSYSLVKLSVLLVGGLAGSLGGRGGLEVDRPPQLLTRRRFRRSFLSLFKESSLYTTLVEPMSVVTPTSVLLLLVLPQLSQLPSPT